MSNKQLIVLCSVLFASAASADDKNADQWIFDTKPITATSPGESKTSFKITDRIYARVFFDQDLKTVFDLERNDRIIIHQQNVITGRIAGPSSRIEMFVAKKDFGKKWIDIDIHPDPAKATSKLGDRSFHNLWRHIGQRKLGVEKVAFSLSTSSVPREATITIDFEGMDTAKVIAKMTEDEKLALAAGSKAFASNVEVPKPGRLHSAALAKATAAMTLKTERGYKRAKIVFTNDDWDIERNEVTGRIIQRSTDAMLVLQETGGKCILESGVLLQQYVGGKFKGPGNWAVTAGSPAEIDCGKGFK